MRSSRETILLNALCVILVLMAGFTRLALYERSFTPNSLILVYFTAAILIWGGQLKRRLLQPHVRKYLIVTAGMMLLWMVLRTVKYEFLPKGHITARYVWYFYYIPMILVPLLFFLSVLYIGRPYDKPISHWWKLLYVPAAALIAGMVSNDWHQNAFYFPKGIACWEDYVHGPLYYVVAGWMIILLVSVLAISFSRCAVPEKRRKIWVPMLPLFVGVLYSLCVILHRENVVTDMLRVPEMGCFLFAAFMECLILLHLFPSNDGYGDFWNASSIGAGIMDNEGIIRYRSEHSISVTPEQVRQAEDQSVLLENGSVALRSHRIQGGFGYWLRDLTELNRLNEKLEDLGNVLEEENVMLEAENQIAEKKARLEQQHELYDAMAKSVSPQLDRIGELLDEPVRDEAEFEERMKFACILNAYVKRHSNLFLIARKNGWIDSGELGLSMAESLEYVRLYGVKTHGRYQGEGRLQGEKVLFVYEFFQTVLESALPGADALLLDLDLTEEVLLLQMELNAPGKMMSEQEKRQEIEALGGSYRLEISGQTEHISLVLPIGGEGV